MSFRELLRLAYSQESADRMNSVRNGMEREPRYQLPRVPLEKAVCLWSMETFSLTPGSGVALKLAREDHLKTGKPQALRNPGKSSSSDH
jgi:hypothetical protein